MYIFWFALALVMISAFIYTEWQITQGLVKRIYKQENYLLPGRMIPYLVIRFFIGSFIVSSLYFGLINFVRADTVPGCWLIPSLIVGTVTAYNTYQRIKYLDFANKKEN